MIGEPMIPVHPPDANLDANMREASVRWNPFWFYRQVRRYGPWDFRMRVGEAFRDFGNFHYGAVGIAFGIPAWLVLRAAGWEHWWTRRSPKTWSRPWGQPPYGDDPRDHAMIRG